MSYAELSVISPHFAFGPLAQIAELVSLSLHRVTSRGAPEEHGVVFSLGVKTAASWFRMNENGIKPHQLGVMKDLIRSYPCTHSIKLYRFFIELNRYLD